MNNPAFQRALRGLAHPVTIMAVVGLLVNDHVLRRLWPSWWTGKLGDVAWLIFAPLLVAALLAWLVPAHLRRREWWVGQLAVAVTGLGFALAKTIPFFHQLAIETLQALGAGGESLRRDPSDLLTLPALLVAWRLWQMEATPRLPRGYIVLMLGALATIANTPSLPQPIDFGILCVGTHGQQLVAYAGYGVDLKADAPERDRVSLKPAYVSEDGGLTWQAASPDGPASTCRPNDSATISVSASTSGYRAQTDHFDLAIPTLIERSTDGGATWQREITVAWSEAQLNYYHRVMGLPRPYLYRPAPLGAFDLVLHEPSGHVLAAMGREGVLVREVTGEWRWAAVGTYTRRAATMIGEFSLQLRDDLWMGLLAACLVFVTLVGYPRRWRARALIWIPLWTAFVATVLVYPSTVAYPIEYWMVSGEALLVLGPYLRLIMWLVFPVAFFAGWAARRDGPTLIAVMGLAAVTGLLFCLPYVLWGLSAIPSYQTAAYFACALVVASLLAGGLGLRTSRRAN